MALVKRHVEKAFDYAKDPDTGETVSFTLQRLPKPIEEGIEEKHHGGVMEVKRKKGTEIQALNIPDSRAASFDKALYCLVDSHNLVLELEGTDAAEYSKLTGNAIAGATFSPDGQLRDNPDLRKRVLTDLDEVSGGFARWINEQARTLRIRSAEEAEALGKT